ncbi:MAG: helix-turn-helix transcriptional regulator [Bacteroidetes bacterium]|nr:helix-turn-helix transcriptional regulator [Bacteroidota bacterium]
MRIPVMSFEEFGTHFDSQRSDRFGSADWSHPVWGHIRKRSVRLSNIRIDHTITDLNNDLQVKYDGFLASQAVHHCMSFAGNIGMQYGYDKDLMIMKPNQFRYSSGPREAYGIVYGKKLSNLHIAIDPEYYVSLLDEGEDWSKQLKQRILERRLFIDHLAPASSGMFSTASQIWENELEGSLKKLYMESKIVELIALQLARLQPSTKPSKGRYDDVMISLREYLDHNFLGNHTLRSLCRQFGVNEFALKKEFRRLFGTTVFHHILSRRLEYARQLLTDTDKTVREVALTVGYRHANHFSAAFTKKFGLTPRMLK